MNNLQVFCNHAVRIFSEYKRCDIFKRRRKIISHSFRRGRVKYIVNSPNLSLPKNFTVDMKLRKFQLLKDLPHSIWFSVVQSVK